jgi:hypothetical protein
MLTLSAFVCWVMRLQQNCNSPTFSILFVPCQLHDRPCHRPKNRCMQFVGLFIFSLSFLSCTQKHIGKLYFTISSLIEIIMCKKNLFSSPNIIMFITVSILLLLFPLHSLVCNCNSLFCCCWCCCCECTCSI